MCVLDHAEDNTTVTISTTCSSAKTCVVDTFPCCSRLINHSAWWMLLISVWVLVCIMSNLIASGA